MRKDENKIYSITLKIIVVLLCGVLIALDFLSIDVAKGDLRRNQWIIGAIQQGCGFVAVVIVLKLLNIRLFGKPQAWTYILPCAIIAIDNFPFWSYFQGNMAFVRSSATDFILFGVYCITIGLFEESVFRGLLFSVVAGLFPKNKKGLIKTFFLTSFAFGFVHLFNLFSGAGIGATLLQVVYTTLTGGLFAFALIKTKNLLIPAFVHALYNFCGLLLSEQGLGTGVVFDLGTVFIMAFISVAIGAFVLYSLYKYPENERKSLYQRLGIDET